MPNNYKETLIPHIYRNKYLRDSSGNINISTSTTGGTTIINNNSDNAANSDYANRAGRLDETHLIFGHNFNGTQDVEGDLINVDNITANGNIHADGNIETPANISADKVIANNLSVKEGIDAPYVHGDELNTDKLSVGSLETGQWLVEEDANTDLHIHTALDKTLRIRPHNIDVLDVSDDRVKVNNKLDLSNTTDGTNVTMGKTNVESHNTNIKSIVEEGFYFTDNDNNVAIGISNNYIQAGIDIGSPNFLAGNSGWRIQPDGTAEFQNLKVDGNLDVYVITYNEMRATNGIMLVTDCGCIEDAIETTIDGTKYWVFTISEFPPFAIDDYVQLQYKSDETRIFSFKGIVTAISADGKNTVRVLPLTGFEGQGTSTDERGTTTFSTVDPDTAYGQYLIRIGNASDTNRQTIIKLNPYDGGYIDFMTGLNAANKLASNDSISGTLPTATRIGNLRGVTYKGTALSGYGLFSDNAYLSGAIKNLQNKWSLNADGSGQVANNHISWDSSGNLTIMIGEDNLLDYIDDIVDDINDTISSTKTELEGTITATAESLTSDYTSKITNMRTTLEGEITTATTELEGKITQSAQALTSDYTSKIQTVDGKITTAESNFTQTANGISSRVTAIENDYLTSSDLNGYVTTSQLQQTANSISAQVGNISVGATNLLKGSKFFETTGTNLYINNGTKDASYGADDFYGVYYLVPSGQNYADIVEWTNIKILPDTFYTLSFWATGSGTIQSFFYHSGGGCVEEGFNSQGRTTTNVDGAIQTTLTDNPTRYWVTWKTKSSVGEYERVIPARVPTGKDIKIWGCKLERGNIATDWSPAPTDNDGGYATGAELTMTANSITGRVSAIENDYVTQSTLTQTANGISSRVTAIENDYITSSELTQTVNSIEANVYDELNQKTGISVKTGKIILDADNTEFTGNIQLKRSSDVLTVLDTNGQTVININNGNVASTPQVIQNRIMLEEAHGLYNYWQTIDPSTFRYQNTITGYNIGTFSTSDSIKFEDDNICIRVASSNYDNGTYDFPSYNYNDGGSYTMTVTFYQVSGDTRYTLHTETRTNQRRFTTQTFSPQINGVVYVDFTFDFNPNRTTMTTLQMDLFIDETLRFCIYKYPTNLTTIGKNGLSVINNAEAYMSFTAEGLKIGAGDYVLVANNNDGLAYNAKGYLNTGSSWNTPIGCPIYNNIWGDSMMEDCVINNEDGTSAITVKGYEVDTKVVNMIHITGTTYNNINWRDDTNYWIILPYAESTMVYIKNSSNKNMRIYSRGVSNGSNTYYSKNIYIDQNIGTRNTGRYYFELEANDSRTLVLYATRNGWFNIRQI